LDFSFYFRINSFEFRTNHGTRIHSFVHRNKENETTTLNGTVAPPTRRLRDTSNNPYSKSYRKPLQTDPSTRPSNSNLKQAPRSSGTKAPVSRSNPSLSTIEEEEETSPTIRRILAATGCSSRQELLAKRAAQEANTKGSKSAAANGVKSAMNQSNAATTNRADATTSRSKSTNGSKTTNPKKKAKSKCCYFY